jgi:hypothetical protein
MMEQRLLQKNVFTLSFPATGTAFDKSGKLGIGSVDHEAYIGELLTFPMSKISNPPNSPFPSSWHIDVHELSFGDHKFDLPNYHGILTTMVPFVGLPMDMWNTLLRELNAQPSIYPYVECDKRDTFPILFFKLGPHQTPVSITPRDYVIELEWPEGNRWCYAPFWGYEHHELPIRNSIILSTGFLRGFYSVFDLDNDTLSRK